MSFPVLNYRVIVLALDVFPFVMDILVVTSRLLLWGYFSGLCFCERAFISSYTTMKSVALWRASWIVCGFSKEIHCQNFDLYQRVFLSASTTTLSLIPETLAITSLNLVINSRNGSSSRCDRLQRSTSEVSLSKNKGYCLRNSDANCRKLPIEFLFRRENHSSAAPLKISTKRRQ